MTLSAHNGYNNRADAYNTDPNQNYSLTDQLRGSARWLDLDLHWYDRELRLCHKGNSGVCSAYDRFYTGAIAEIGAWLNWHPNEVILIGLEDKIGDDADATTNDRVNNPIEQFLDQNPNVAGAHRVYKPGDDETVCPDTCTDGRWPSQRELLAAGKQVVMFDDSNTRGGKYLWPDAEHPGYPNSNAVNIDFDKCAPKNDTATQYWQAAADTWTSAGEDRVYFGAQYSYAGLIDNFRAKQLAGCNVTKIGLDMFQASQTTTLNTCTVGKIKEQLDDPCPNPDDRVANTIWSWSDGDRGQYGNRALLSGGDGRWKSRTAPSNTSLPAPSRGSVPRETGRIPGALSGG